MVGLLSNPFVTTAWALEQLDVHVLGSTPRASDLRILLSFICNLGAVIACNAPKMHENPSGAIIHITGLSYVFSHNIFKCLGLKKPFTAASESQLTQIAYSNIVFSNVKSKPNSSIPVVTKKE